MACVISRTKALAMLALRWPYEPLLAVFLQVADLVGSQMPRAADPLAHQTVYSEPQSIYLEGKSSKRKRQRGRWLGETLRNPSFKPALTHTHGCVLPQWCPRHRTSHQRWVQCRGREGRPPALECCSPGHRGRRCSTSSPCWRYKQSIKKPDGFSLRCF